MILRSLHNTNGGGEIQVIMGVPGITIELPTPTKENYVFVEWQDGMVPPQCLLRPLQ